MKHILTVILFFIATMAFAQDVPMLDKNRFEAIVQFVLDNGWNAFISEDNRLTPNVRYKNMIVYIVPNFHTRQRVGIGDYNRIIVFGQGAVPIRNEGPRFDITKEGEHIHIEDKSIFDENILNAYLAQLNEMLQITRVAENMNSLISKSEFDNIVRFVLDNGRDVLFSSLWGSSPSITYKGITIHLVPNGPHFNADFQTRMRNEVSHYRRLIVSFQAEGGRRFEMGMGIHENNEVYIHVTDFNNRILYENVIATDVIPLLIEMIND